MLCGLYAISMSSVSNCPGALDGAFEYIYLLGPCDGSLITVSLMFSFAVIVTI